MTISREVTAAGAPQGGAVLKAIAAPIGALALGFLAYLGLLLALGNGSLGEGVLAWYSFLNGVNSGVASPLTQLAQRLGVPAIAALLLGLLGATSPCQLSTNAAALAYVAQGGARPSPLGRSTLGYLLGKIVVYTILGGAAILAGAQLSTATVPFVSLVRKALGPLMVFAGLYLLGMIPLNFSIGQGARDWLEARTPSAGFRGGFVLGSAFGLAFCPTLFLLFFGLTVPMAVASRGGVGFPALFALGTSLPLLVLVGVMWLGGRASGKSLRPVARLERLLRPGAGAIFLLAGINDTVLYWLL